MSASLSGDAVQRFRDALELSERNRRRADRIRDRVHRQHAADVRRRYRNAEMRDPSAAELDVLLDRIVAENSDFKTACSDEKWGLQLAAAYGPAVIAEQNDRIISLLERLNATLAGLAVAEVPEPPS